VRGTHASLDLQQVERLIDFAKNSANAEIGFGHLGAEGYITQNAAPSMLITARMTFTFAIASTLGFSGTAELAQRGIGSLSKDFYDRENGGFFSIAPGFGDSGRKSAYDTAFVLLAASSAQVLDIPGAAALTDIALETLFDKFWRDDLGIFANSFNPDFSREEPYLGANANMHAVEALISCPRVDRRRLAAGSSAGNQQLYGEHPRPLTRLDDARAFRRRRGSKHRV
jgi:mannose/cellobiose epimerase-like protein (N-acyl-D-glucosamine 2-epimerase family)